MNYPDTVRFVKTGSSGYANNKTITSQSDVKSFFLQNTGMDRQNFADGFVADAICYPIPTDSFIKTSMNRLEGYYIVSNPFGEVDNQSWYRVERVEVNRDHLLGNQIDNIRLLLKKTKPVVYVS